MFLPESRFMQNTKSVYTTFAIPNRIKGFCWNRPGHLNHKLFEVTGVLFVSRFSGDASTQNPQGCAKRSAGMRPGPKTLS